MHETAQAPQRSLKERVKHNQAFASCNMTASTTQLFDAKDGAAQTGRPAKHAIDSPIYSTDEFRMYCFKVLPCSKRYPHNWQACPFAHPGEKARRRCLRAHKYAATPCTHKQQGLECPHGDGCSMTHSIFEYWLHPDMYRTQLCNDMGACKRNICFFAHSLGELRVPSLTAKPAATEPAITSAPSSSSSSILDRKDSLTRTMSTDYRTLSDIHSKPLPDTSMCLPRLSAPLRTDSAGSGSSSSSYAWELALQSSISSCDSSLSSCSCGAGAQYPQAFQQQQVSGGNLDLILQLMQLQQGPCDPTVHQLLTQLSASTNNTRNTTNPAAAAAAALAAAAAAAATREQLQLQTGLLASAFRSSTGAVGHLHLTGQPGLTAAATLVPSASLPPTTMVPPAYEGKGATPVDAFGCNWMLPSASSQLSDIFRGLTAGNNLTAHQAGNNIGGSAGSVLLGNAGLTPTWSAAAPCIWSNPGGK